MSYNDRVPDYLLGKRQLILTVLAAAFFSLVFILVSVPFSKNAWFALGGEQAFGLTLAFFVLSLGIVITSKSQMYRLRFAPEFTLWQYLAWNLGEAVIICLLYTFFTVEGNQYGLIDIGEVTFQQIFISSAVYVAVALGVPYIVMAQYFTINEKNNTIRLLNMREVVTDSEPAAWDEEKITLFDNSGVLKLSVRQSNLYFIESDDNYIKVWYMDGAGSMKQYMLRCKLQTVEDSFAGSDLVRCHRKYIVNVSKIDVLVSQKDGYYLDLGIDSVEPIPVSKTYEDAVLERFNSR